MLSLSAHLTPEQTHHLFFFLRRETGKIGKSPSPLASCQPEHGYFKLKTFMKWIRLPFFVPQPRKVDTYKTVPFPFLQTAHHIFYCRIISHHAHLSRIHVSVQTRMDTQTILFFWLLPLMKYSPFETRKIKDTSARTIRNWMKKMKNLFASITTV